MYNKDKRKVLYDPVATYTEIESQRNTIIDNNKNKAGVYKWTNTQTGDFYVGSSTNLSRRLLYYLNYKYMIKYEYKSIIYFALLKYGYKNFILEILEYSNKKDTTTREQHYIDTYKPKYNILNFAASSLGFKHSELTKLQMSINNTKEKHPFFNKNILNNKK